MSPVSRPNATRLLHDMVQMGASDLHMRSGTRPAVRVNGRLRPMPGAPELTQRMIAELLVEIIKSKSVRDRLRDEREIDLSFALSDGARFRVNAFIERGEISVALRSIASAVPTIEEVGVPQALVQACSLSRGLVLVTGPTGSGKSTTLAAMVRHMNETREANILTIEDPIEYMHEPRMSLIRQREVGRDTLSFSRALRSALRQDPDVILVGEMRDLETIEVALTAAETGHLVLSTLHTRSATETVNRIIDVFPAEQQSQIRAQFASALAVIASQVLVPRADGSGRVSAHEVMTGTDAVRNAIREGKTPYLRSVLQTSRQDGMQTLDASLGALVRSGTVSLDAALAHAQDPRELHQAAGLATEEQAE